MLIFWLFSESSDDEGKPSKKPVAQVNGKIPTEKKKPASSDSDSSQGEKPKQVTVCFHLLKISKNSGNDVKNESMNLCDFKLIYFRHYLWAYIKQYFVNSYSNKNIKSIEIL